MYSSRGRHKRSMKFYTKASFTQSAVTYRRKGINFGQISQIKNIKNKK